MSCRLIHRSSIVDFASIASYLKDGSESRGIQEDSGDAQEMQTERIQEQESRRQNKPKSFLSNCLLSLSPAEDLIVVAKETRAIFLAKKHSAKAKDEQDNWNEIYWKGDLCQDEGELISSVICVPLASQQRSSQGSPDCSCVIVGFTSGYVRIYLQTGIQLLSQFLHDGPVTGLDLKTKLPVKDALLTDQGEELIILYPNAIVVIDGFSLFMALKACRNQIAKAQASKNQEAIQPPPLAYRKWRLIGQEKVYDIVNCGMVTLSMFDKLVVSSLNPDSRQATSSGTRKFITSGANPFIGWYELKEENSAPLMSEVAMNVASQLTNAFISKISSATSDWITSRFMSQPAKETKPIRPPKPPVEIGTPMNLRYGLPDKRRRAESIVMSPDGSLAACTDDFGRILVISNDNGLVVRMLKGYRDAQCGWIVVDDRSDEQMGKEQEDKKIRQAVFLVIYAPRRGILEIWLAEQGNRVGAFNVGKDCRLIYNGFGTLGSRVSGNGDPSVQLVSCFVMESNGSLSSINVPFHCSLSLLHSFRARDSYLLRKISATLEKGFGSAKNDDQISTIKQWFQEMEAPETLFQAMQRISSCKNLTSESMKNVISSTKDVLVAKAESSSAGDDIEYIAEIIGMISVFNHYLKLIELYDLLRSLTDSDNYMDEDNSTGTFEDIAGLLDLSEEEKSRFQEALNKDQISQDKNLTSKTDLTVAEFLDFFFIDSAGSSSQSDIPREESRMKMKIPDDLSNAYKLGWLYYMPYIKKSVPVSQFDAVLYSQYFDAGVFMCLLMTYCQSIKLTNVNLEAVYHIMNLIIEANQCVHERTKNDILDIWMGLRYQLEQSKSTKNCLLLAHVCKSILTKHFKQRVQDKNETESQISWHVVEGETKEWNKLIVKLEDLFLLANFLQKGHFDSDGMDSANSYFSKLSIKDVSEGGKGAVTQIVAAHIVRCRVPGPCVAGMASQENVDMQMNIAGHQRDADDNSEIIQALMELKNRFPYSLERDILLAHCCWECILLWKKDVEDVSVLSSAVVHLSTISSNFLKQGLVVLFWKAIFKEGVKNTFNLIEKVGKSPKDRLCRKHIGMSTTALEKYLLTAHSLLRQALQAEDSSNMEFPELRMEQRWETNARNSASIIESALDEPKCEMTSLKNMWNLTVTLWLIILTGMKSICTSKLFSPEEIRNATQLFPAPSQLPNESNATTQEARTKFCQNSLSLIVDKFASSDEEDMQCEIMTKANEVIELANNFLVDDDALWQNFTVDLFSAGLDNPAYEAMLSVHHKEDLVEPLLETCGSRLSSLLLETSEANTLSKVISSLPTHITSWLQYQNSSKANAKNLTINDNIKLLNKISSINSHQNDFIKDLIDSLEIFCDL